MEEQKRSIAYFSMEMGLEVGIPTYSGGLGILAGDTVRQAADLRIPMVAVTLLHRKGYFRQTLDASGWQQESPEDWQVEDFLMEMPQRVSVKLRDREVWLRVWKYQVTSLAGFAVPVFFLDTELAENSEWDRTLSHYLYGGDERYRLCQEILLGIGGIKMLRALGYRQIERFHMNEGHASLLALELLSEIMQRAPRPAVTEEDIETVRKQCVFTTHTPVPAGHDQFPVDLVDRVLGYHPIMDRKDIYCCDNILNMTHLALNLSHYVNGVAKKHGEVSRNMFGRYGIDSITNGVHAATWTSQQFQELYDRYIPGWREDNFSLRNALNIPKEEVWQAHQATKQRLVEYVHQHTGAQLDPNVLTLGFARRATAYKRADLLFLDLERLRKIPARSGRIQVIYAGKAHPKDEPGKHLIQRIFKLREQLSQDISVVYVPNYNIEVGQLITAGVDIWLNTPEPPLEASGTSGMKAALNGVPSFSVMDGWWIEGCIEGVTGWSIGESIRGAEPGGDRSHDAASLYFKLESVIIPMYYSDRERFIHVMLHAIALNGSFFNTQRMMMQYVMKAYFH